MGLVDWSFAQNELLKKTGKNISTRQEYEEKSVLATTEARKCMQIMIPVYIHFVSTRIYMYIHMYMYVCLNRCTMYMYMCMCACIHISTMYMNIVYV